MGSKRVRDKLEAYTDGSSKKTFHSTMINVYFMYRRLLMVTVFIYLKHMPSIQVTCLMVFTVVNFLFTVAARPYEENNNGEIFNEFAILICVYITHFFFVTSDLSSTQYVGWAFISICLLNMFISMCGVIFTVSTKTYYAIKEKKLEKARRDVFLKRHENLLVIETADLSHLKDLKTEQETFVTV